MNSWVYSMDMCYSNKIKVCPVINYKPEVVHVEGKIMEEFPFRMMKYKTKI